MGTQADEFAGVRGRDEGGGWTSRGGVGVSDTRIGMMSDLKYKFGHVSSQGWLHAQIVHSTL